VTHRSVTGAVALLAAALALLAVSPTLAQAKFFGGAVPDVPGGAAATAATAAGPVTQAHVAEQSDTLPYNGGRVLHSNRTHVIFWDPDGSGLAFDPGYQTLIETFLTDVAADSHRTTNVYSLSGQYTDGTGRAAYDSTYGGSVVATDPLPANGCTEPAMTGPGWTVCLTDAQLETEIEHVVATDNLPATNHDIYFLVTPSGLGSCTDASSSSCALGGRAGGYCGYHSNTAGEILYAVIPYNGVPGHCQSTNPRPNSSTADPTISTISHEQNETVTDPYGDAWIDTSGEEMADLCLTSFGPRIGGSSAKAWNEAIHGGHFFLQEEWSDADGGCESRAKSDALSFGLTRAAGRARTVSLLARGSDPDGRLVNFQWVFGDDRAGGGRRVSHTFSVPGTYRVMLRSTDSWGNWAFASRTVRIRAR
jgi:hypothetical protein